MLRSAALACARCDMAAGQHSTRSVVGRHLGHSRGFFWRDLQLLELNRRASVQCRASICLAPGASRWGCNGLHTTAIVTSLNPSLQRLRQCDVHRSESGIAELASRPSTPPFVLGGHREQVRQSTDRWTTQRAPRSVSLRDPGLAFFWGGL